MSFRQTQMTLAIVVLFAAACGGDDDDTSTKDAGPDGSTESSSGTGGKAGSSSAGKGGSASAGKSGSGAAAAGKGGTGGKPASDTKAGSGGSKGDDGKGDDGKAGESGGKAGASGGKAGESGGKAGTGGKEAAGSTAPAAGSSGSGTAGSSPAASAGTGGTIVVGDDDAGTAVPVDGPYFTSGRIRGYVGLGKAPTATTLSVSGYGPGNVTGTFAPPICISGRVAPTADQGGNAQIVINLNQPLEGGAEAQAFIPSSTGIRVSVSNANNAPLRAQIQSLVSPTGEQSYWCSYITGTGGLIRWDQFNTACWDDSGVAYARQPVGQLVITVPGTTTDPVPYEVCLNSLTEDSGTATDEDAGI